MLGGLGPTIAQGMAFGGVSAMAHRVVDFIMGHRTIQHEIVGSEGVASPVATNISSIGGSDACGNQNKAFQDVTSYWHGLMYMKNERFLGLKMSFSLFIHILFL